MFGFLASPRARRASSIPAEVSLDVAGEAVPVAVRVSDRAVRYSLRLSPSGDVVLTLPRRGGSYQDAMSFLDRHRGWLAERLARRPKKVAFEPGAVLPIRGLPHVVVHRPGQRGTVWLDPATDETTHGMAGERPLYVAGGAEHVARRIADYLKREARADLAAAVALHAGRLGVSAGPIRLKDTKSRWGSCTAEGELSFSWRIVMAPPHVLDYLAAHEVAHIREMNHSHRFWAQVAATCPNWREGRHWLKTRGAGLHAYG